MTNGQLLIGSTGSAAVPATLTGTANQVIVGNGAGSITLSLPQSINTTSSPTFSALTVTNNISASTYNSYTPENAANKGAASGYAPLDSGSKIPVAYLPSAVMEYQGVWNSATNTPTLNDTSGSPVNGYVYRVSVASTGAIAGLSDPSMAIFYVGDFVVYSGALTKWQRSPASDGVVSVNGATGAVTVNAINQLTGDVTAGPASGSASAASTVAKIQGTTVSGTTGSTNVVFSNSPVLVSPALGTPSALIGTNITGTATAFTASNVTTNANLTGVITSVGNATSIASQTGTGTKFVVDTSPTLVTPVIGAATGTSLSVSGQLTSTVSTGTAPLVVSSTTQVANLNAATAGSATTATTATNATNVATTQVSNSASYFPLMVSSSTNGNQACDLGTGLTFNPSTNNLSTTTFTGALSGNATTSTTATNATNVATTQVSNSASYFPLMVSSSTNGNQAADLGTGLTFNPSTNNLSTTTFTGALAGNSTTATSATTATNATNTAITDDTTTNATMYPTWVTANTGNLPQKTTSTKLTFNPSTGILSSTSFTGAGTGLTGTASSLTSGTVTTNANLTGDVTSSGNSTTLTNAPVIAKVLTGFVSGAGTVSATDSILSAFQKINGNVAGLSGTVTSVTFTGDGTVLSSTPSSAVTTSGTVTGTLKTQNANLVLAGPTSGSAATPTFRAAASSDVNGTTDSNATDLVNIAMKYTINSSALTATVTQRDGSTAPSTDNPSVYSLRSTTATTGSYTHQALTATASVVIASATTLGMSSSTDTFLYFYGASSGVILASTALYDEQTLQTFVAESAAVTATNASPCVFTESAHNRQNGDILTLTGTPPTGFSTATNYYIVSRAAGTYQLSATSGGAAINSSSTGTSVVVHAASARLVCTSGTASAAGQAIRLLGRALFNITAGTWAAPSEISPPSRQSLINNASSNILFASGTTGTVYAPQNTTTNTMYKFVIVGAGGGGGGSNGVTAAAGGGGAGGLAIGTFKGIAPGAVITVTVGAAGTGGANTGGTGVTGGSSSIAVTGITTITVTGGVGGTGSTLAVAGAGGAGGAGGAASGGSINLVNMTGSSGTYGYSPVATVAQGLGGAGGGSYYGSGAGGGNAGTGNGVTAISYGSGGSGAIYTTGIGGSGAGGYIILEQITP